MYGFGFHNRIELLINLHKLHLPTYKVRSADITMSQIYKAL